MDVKFTDFFDWDHKYREVILREGESYHTWHAEPTDEGFWSMAVIYSHEGDVIRCEHYTKSRDCDGILETFSEVEARIDELAYERERLVSYDRNGNTVVKLSRKIKLPNWKQTHVSQRNQYAEMAGY